MCEACGGGEPGTHCFHVFPKSWKNSKLLHNFSNTKYTKMTLYPQCDCRVAEMAEHESTKFSRFCVPLLTVYGTAKSTRICLKRRRLSWQFTEGKDVFVSLPTGFGKSISFQILPFVFAEHDLGVTNSNLYKLAGRLACWRLAGRLACWRLAGRLACWRLAGRLACCGWQVG